MLLVFIVINCYFVLLVLFKVIFRFAETAILGSKSGSFAR